jgi:hypothetical protein
LQSNGFNQAAWATSSLVVDSGYSGYDGTNDAYRINATAASGFLRQELTNNGVLSASIYAKKNTADGIRVRFDHTTDTNVYVDLRDGSVFTSGNTIDINIEDVSGGWYRITFAFNASGMVRIQLYPTDGATNAVSGSVFVQDAQLEYGLVARDYIETTTAAVYGGITDNTPRLDYTDSSCPALLLEPLRTNLATQSEYFTDIFTENSGVTWEANSTTSPEGLTNAFKLNNSNAGSSGAYYVPLAFTDNDTMTASIFAKEGDVSELLFGITNQNESKSLYYSFDLSAGTATYNANNGGILNGSGSIVDYGNGWYRCIVTGTFPSSGTTSGGVFPRIASGYVYLYGLQVEAASYATSYIPTYGSSVTRLDDYAYAENDMFNIGTNNFTAFIDIDSLNYSAPVSGNYFTAVIGNRESGASNWWRIWSNNVPNALFLELRSTGYLNYTLENSPISSTRKKICIVRNGNTIKAFINGVQKLNQTHSTIGGALSTTNDRLEISAWNSGASANCFMPTNEVLYFESALTDQEAIDLTTI